MLQQGVNLQAMVVSDQDINLENNLATVALQVNSGPTAPATLQHNIQPMVRPIPNNPTQLLQQPTQLK